MNFAVYCLPSPGYHRICHFYHEIWWTIIISINEVEFGDALRFLIVIKNVIVLIIFFMLTRKTSTGIFTMVVAVCLLLAASTQSNTRGDDKISQRWLHQVSAKHSSWQYVRVQQTDAAMFVHLFSHSCTFAVLNVTTGASRHCWNNFVMLKSLVKKDTNRALHTVSHLIGPSAFQQHNLCNFVMLNVTTGRCSHC